MLGIQQIAIGSETRNGLDELWYKVLGLKQPANRVKLEKENVEEDIVSLGPHPFAVEIDLMTPIDPDKSPKVRPRKMCVFSCRSGQSTRCPPPDSFAYYLTARKNEMIRFTFRR